MCEDGSKLKLCTCEIGEERIPGVYYWTLSRFVGLKESMIIGKIMVPTKDLGANITTDLLLDILNGTDAPFDFDYTPVDNDTLSVSISKNETHHEYFSLIYSNEKWEKGRNPAFRSIQEEIASGVIESRKLNLWRVFSDYLVNGPLRTLRPSVLNIALLILQNKCST